MSKVDLQTINKYLDQRADNYFAYDEDEKCWVLVQTWHVYLHKVKTKKDKYEVRQFRAAVRFDNEPTEDDIAKFAVASEQALNDHMAGSWWHGDVNDGEMVEPWRFNRWFVKDHRQV